MTVQFKVQKPFRLQTFSIFLCFRLLKMELMFVFFTPQSATIVKQKTASGVFLFGIVRTLLQNIYTESNTVLKLSVLCHELHAYRL